MLKNYIQWMDGYEPVHAFTMFTAWILAFSCQLYNYRKSPSEIYIKKFYDQHKGFYDYALDRSEKLGYLPWLLIITYHHDSTTSQWRHTL